MCFYSLFIHISRSSFHFIIFIYFLLVLVLVCKFQLSFMFTFLELPPSGFSTCYKTSQSICVHDMHKWVCMFILLLHSFLLIHMCTTNDFLSVSLSPALFVSLPFVFTRKQKQEATKTICILIVEIKESGCEWERERERELERWKAKIFAMSNINFEFSVQSISSFSSLIFFLNNPLGH